MSLVKDLCDACGDGDLVLVKELIAQGASINGISCYGDTPLHDSLDCCKIKVVELLLSQAKLLGIDIVNERSPTTGFYPLEPWRSNKMIKLLISYGADYSRLIEYYEMEELKEDREELERMIVGIGVDRVKMV